LWEQAGSYAASVDRRLLGALYPTGVVAGCAVTVSAGTMNMNIAVGSVAAPAANNTGSVLCYSDAVEVVTSTAAPASGNTRIDLIVCQPRGNDLDGGANNDFVFTVVAGTATTGTPATPATPAGAVPLAQITVVGGSASLSAANLTDLRAPMFSLTPTAYKLRVYRAGAFTTLPSAVVGYDTISYGTSSWWNTGTGTFTCPAAGDWLVVAQFSYLADAAGQYNVIAITRAGTAIATGAPSFSYATGNVVAGMATDIVPLTVGQQLTIVQTTNASGKTGSPGSDRTFLTLRLLD
jgi:hypothetical protein